jgi:hypothetical protein
MVEIVVLYEGRVIFKQCILKKHTSFGIKIITCVILRDVGLCTIRLCIQAKIENTQLPR